jgi:hypothetical protein
MNADVVAGLDRLAQLHAAGQLTDEQFVAARADLLRNAEPLQNSVPAVPGQRTSPGGYGPPPQRRPTAEAPPGGYAWAQPQPQPAEPPPSGGAGLWWVAAALVVVALVVAGVILRLTVFGPDTTSAQPPPVAKGQPDDRAPAPPTATRAPEPRPTATRAPEPTPITELRPVGVTADSTSPASVDDSGQQVTYDATNVVDGRADTAWRTAGDASTQSLHFTFGRPVQLATVGLIPGYAKTDPATGVDRFTQNRRVLQVAWTADDGYSVVQDFRDERTLQTVPFERTTTTLTLTILRTTPPGERDFTALSEVEFTGRTG